MITYYYRFWRIELSFAHGDYVWSATNYLRNLVASKSYYDCQAALFDARLAIDQFLTSKGVH